MAVEDPAGTRLESWKDIAKYLNKGVTTVQRYEREEGLPVHRHEHQSLATVYAYTHELDAWRESRRAPRVTPAEALPPPTPVPASHPAPPQRSVTRRIWVAGGLMAAVAALTSSRFVNNAQPPTARPLLNSGTNERSPSLDATGRYLAYQEVDHTAIRNWLLDRETGKTTELGSLPLATGACQLRLSPDAARIAYLTLAGGDLWDVCVRDREGGVVRKVARLDGSGLAWAPDSQTLVVTTKPAESEPVSVYAVNRVDAVPKLVSRPPAASWGDIDVAVSPDGTHLAVIRYKARGDGDIWLLSWDGRVERRLTNMHTWINGLTFTADGRELIFSPVGTHIRRLFRVAVDGSRLSELPTPGVISPSHPSAGGSALVFEDKLLFSRLYRGSVVGKAVQDERLASDIRASAEYGTLSHDGSRFAWLQPDGVWVREGGAEPRLTLPLTGDKRELAWSPDHRHMAVTLREQGKWHVWILETDSRAKRRLTSDQANEGRAVWSASGKYIYWRSERGGESRYYRSPWPEVSATPEPVTSLATAGMPDGQDRFFYYLESDQRSPIREVAIGRESAPRELTHVGPVKPGSWLIRGQDVLYGDTRADAGGVPIRRAPVRGGSPELLFHLPVSTHDSFDVAISPDGKEVLWSRPHFQEDLWIIDDFR